ncbi:hypothetical protein EMIHUDRAFT_113060 [Emiliania huxleyi CCMP1516]|uniref:ABC transporter domain-containing protein n=2 Tax=Emiliania huxleyi TaxID=2903 RepID=A0A0D3K4V4_EMIH1|nr:hypothetical protein EMIHUDRAFT_113060 [Emiliania huxleyi CCMP1516]EOD30789.1 hypothetical protein EMIHUDRAFT_113060 [Emiliania huxleyi CCMP1516]|eukprot:XP_005783218.1 hypothetical protein EMIHUDRAFT_113060 [Emiliania huxleyi CCMP1516]
MPSARDTASTLLAGLDEDVLDYLVTMLEGDEEQEAMEATVAEFLLSTEHVATEEEATAKCRELFAALSCAGAADAAETAAAPEPELKVLEQKTSIAESDSHLFRDVSKDELGGRLVDLDEALEVRRKRKARQEAELRAVRAAHSRVLAQRAAEDAALAAATTAAVELRAKQGAYTGAASFTLVRGRIYALIGRNGKGKSTLLRALASRLVGDIPPALTVHYVSQEVHYVSQEVQLGEERLGWTPAQAEELEALELAAAASDEQAAAGGAAGGRGRASLTRPRHVPCRRAGCRRPDLLLLDEPTNHLSIGAVLWLARELSTSPTWQQRMAVVVSHDRVFLDEAATPHNLSQPSPALLLSAHLGPWLTSAHLGSPRLTSPDEVATDTLHVSGAARQLTQSRGNYSGWAKRRAQQQLTHEREMESKRRMIAELRAFKPLGSTPKQMKIFKSKEKMADKLEEEERIATRRPTHPPDTCCYTTLRRHPPPMTRLLARELDEQAASLTEDAELPLSLKAGGEVSGFLVQVKGVSFGYPGSAAPLFSGVEMGIDARSRIVLLGENGNGKTTRALVKLLLGDLAPTAGEVVSAGGVRIALVNQHHADQIDLTLSPLQFLMERFPGDGSYAHEQALRSHLSGCGVTSEMMTLPSSALSGGQRSRVALAAVSYTQPHIIVLDEPTNNLDLESVAALADCLDSFEGGVVLVSHDQYFVGRVAKEVWLVDKGSVRRLPSFDVYRTQQLNKLK